MSVPNLFFISDTHFFHKNIIRSANRPFESMEEMNEILIQNWNSLVSHRDTIIHAGDFSFRAPNKESIEGVLSRLNGHKFLVRGNHDKKDTLGAPGWEEVTDYKEIKRPRFQGHRQQIKVFHYAIRTWEGMGRGSWMLHGHSHGNLKDLGGKTMDIGVDALPRPYFPIEYEEVKIIMDQRDIVKVDHH